MTHPKILVLGSTGAIGKEVSQALIRRKAHFRAAVHTESKAGFLREHKELVELVELDLTKHESIEKALEGIEKIFLLTPPGYTLAAHPLIEAAKRHKVKHIVKLAAWGAQEEDKTKFEWAYEHRLVEEAIVKAGIPLTSLRPSSLFTNIFDDSYTIKTQSAFYKIMGDTKMNWISNHDIGEVAAIILTHEGHEHFGKYYVITGPETLSFHEIADLFSAQLGRKINYVVIDEEQLKKVAATFLPAQSVAGFVNMNIYFKNGGYDFKSGDLEKITGHKGKHLKDFIHDNIAAFQ